MKINRYVLSEFSDAERTSTFARAQTDLTLIESTVRDIIADVRDRGDDALLEYTKQFDGAELTAATLQVTADEFDEAESKIEPELRDALAHAIKNIFEHHRGQLPT